MDYMSPKVELFCRMKRREFALRQHLEGIKKSQERMRLLGVLGRLVVRINRLFAEINPY